MAQKKNATIDKRVVDLDARLSTLLSDWKTPGFAVAIVEKSK